MNYEDIVGQIVQSVRDYKLHDRRRIECAIHGGAYLIKAKSAVGMVTSMPFSNAPSFTRERPNVGCYLQGAGGRSTKSRKQAASRRRRLAQLHVNSNRTLRIR